MDYEDETDEEKEFRYRVTDDRFFLRVLEEDVQRCEQLFAATPSDDFTRRTLVRTIFAQVEGMTASAIDWARYYASEESLMKDRYTEAERAVLRGVVARVNDKGVACMESEQRYLSSKVNIRFALSLVGRGAAKLPEVDYGDGGWAALLRGFSVRNRLMHPKVANDLVVNDAELDQVRQGRDWFVKTYTALEAALQATLREEIGRKFAEWDRARENDPKML